MNRGSRNASSVCELTIAHCFIHLLNSKLNQPRSSDELINLICVYFRFLCVNLKEKVKFLHFLLLYSRLSHFFFKHHSLLCLPSEGDVPPPSINATIKVSTLLVLDLTSDPTLPNASTSPPTAPAVVNKERGSLSVHISWIQTAL
ncbi:hypothetical protein ATANTOWER_005436 [Ataeniobius toweri]|uniref:Uncharacterized protein n=1 Tax=Ataeniobius toweri TaxID=208326 RepID=A0ABU7AV45_9TELE|nr:hypothetical protein [Ataeniobius toweri]